jgi:hypothetical protein
LEIKTGFEQQKVFKNVNDSLKKFLAPWIKNDNAKISMEYLVINPAKPTRIQTDAIKVRIAAFIKTLDGIAGVKDIQLKTWDYENDTSTPDSNMPVVPVSEANEAVDTDYLLVQIIDHDLKT